MPLRSIEEDNFEILQFRLESNVKNLERIDDAVDRADNKSAIISAFNIGLLSIFMASLALWGGIEGLVLSEETIVTTILLFLTSFILSSISTFFSFTALFPRLRAKSDSLFYFGFLSHYETPKDLQEVFDSVEPQKHLEHIEEQIFQVSHIATTKYARLRKAVIFLIPSVILWTITMCLLFVLFLTQALRP